MASRSFYIFPYEAIKQEKTSHYKKEFQCAFYYKEKIFMSKWKKQRTSHNIPNKKCQRKKQKCISEISNSLMRADFKKPVCPEKYYCTYKTDHKTIWNF